MKYFSELSRIEDSIIRLSSLESVIITIASGVKETNLEDAEAAIWYVSGSIESIHNDLRNDFNELWDIVGDEPDDEIKKEKYKGGMKKKKMMTDRELP